MNQASARFVIALCALMAGSAAHAQTAAPNPAPAPVTPYADMRYRLELVDQGGLPEQAAASTLRVRAGVKTAEWQGFRAGRRRGDRESGRSTITIRSMARCLSGRGRPGRCAAQPGLAALEAGQGGRGHGGRQAINLDNQRWIGSVGWRQNDQTLDAARVVVKPAPGFTAEYLHAWRVNRVFGPDSPQGIWRDTAINGLRAAYTIKNVGTLSAYGYWLDIPSQPSSSSKRLGVRIAGELPVAGKSSILYVAEYARQHDYGNNPRRFGAGLLADRTRRQDRAGDAEGRVTSGWKATARSVCRPRWRRCMPSTAGPTSS
jgi:hypothetical protein